MINFDLETESESLERARQQRYEVTVCPSGKTELVAFEDSGTVHETRLKRAQDGWEGNCWLLDHDGNRVQTCKGFAHHDGPCAHLWAVRSWKARNTLEGGERYDHAIETAARRGKL